ncbi:helix-turn-helix domain-containing protein [Paraclostridium sordellii]|uniref:helix-turn-helix domain-containing protein n=1 Tax=Paraclostridium sordellii TaxID=1505 RepID=UPI0012B0AFCF|nr:helix-turn-helix domain-containing protein [Paeniclostridium sordellii]
MQIADRFHIHQNLLQAIKKALYKEISSTIKIENDIKTQCNSEQNDHGKKILKTVDNFTAAEQIRIKLIYKIQEMKNDGYSISEISRLLGKDRRTIKRYIQGEVHNLCKHSRKRNNPYENRVISLIKIGYVEKQIVDILLSEGCKLSKSNARHMIRKVVKENNLKINKVFSC